MDNVKLNKLGWQQNTVDCYQLASQISITCKISCEALSFNLHASTLSIEGSRAPLVFCRPRSPTPEGPHDVHLKVRTGNFKSWSVKSTNESYIMYDMCIYI